VLFKVVERKWWYFLASALLIVPGVIFLSIGGLRPGIEFKGGSLLEADALRRRGASDRGARGPRAPRRGGGL